METCSTVDRLKVARSSIAEALATSAVYRDYHAAFTAATGMPLAFHPAGDWKLPFDARKDANTFCAMLAQHSATCSDCMSFREDLVRNATHTACTLTCPFGLVETAVPVRNGSQLVAVLRTGQIAHSVPDPCQVRRIGSKIRALGIADTAPFEKAYRATPVVERKRYDAFVHLLSIFADQLGAVSNEVVIRQANEEPSVVIRAKKFIREHNAEELSLQQVARAVNTSASYFCRLFKRATGINYSQYRARVRLEHAKQLLLNPNLRVGEIAYEVGFQSLTHFNRVFKNILGQSPSEYRAQHHSARS